MGEFFDDVDLSGLGPDEYFDEEVPHTFDEWKEWGFSVIKGEKHTGRNRLGVCTFTREQVTDHDDMICDPYDEF